MKYNFTYIIGYRHRADRLVNLRKVIDWLVGFNGIEIILVEQDVIPRLENHIFPVKYIYTKSELPYNRSWAFNVGARQASSERIVCGDCDLIMNPDDFFKGLKELENFDTVSPYTKVIDLTQQEINLPLSELNKINRNYRGQNDNQKINFSGGITLFNKDSYFSIGGYPEEFVGWGGEDNAMTLKINTLLKYKEIDNKVYHLYHQPEQPIKAYYENNLRLLDEFSKLPIDNRMMYINSTLKYTGNVNKYNK
jgi:predicted glycosyltransferase involved in capsule biosynthesis